MRLYLHYERKIFNICYLHILHEIEINIGR